MCFAMRVFFIDDLCAYDAHYFLPDDAINLERQHHVSQLRRFFP